MSDEYEFTVEYYYVRYHTGQTDVTLSRVGIVCAKTVSDAIMKIKAIDGSFITDKKVVFKPLGFETNVKPGFSSDDDEEGID